MLVLLLGLAPLELEAPDLSEIFWRAADPDGVEELALRIVAQYLQLQEDERLKLRSLVAQLLVLGAVRGLGWGLMPNERDRRSGKKPDDKITRKKPDKFANIIIKCKMAKDLLSQEKQVSAREICRALDKDAVELPWADLQKVSGWWEPHHKEKKVMNAIKRARDMAKQTAEDIRYLEEFEKAAKKMGKGRAARKKKAAKTAAKQGKIVPKDEE